jgi:cobalt-zinc-cadmium efflux system membrane fusion protein
LKRNKIMANESISNKTEQAEDQHEALTSVVVRRFRKRFQQSPVQVLFLSVLTLSLIALSAYLLWPRQEKMSAAVETPPTLESKHAAGEKEEHEEGEEHEEHSQEGAIEVDDETAELIGLKTEPAANGEIEDTIAVVGKVLVAPNGQAIVGAKTDGRAIRVIAEPGQQVRAGQVVVVVDSPQIAELRGQLIEAQSKLKLAEQNLARTTKSENRAAVIQARNKLDFAKNNLERKRRLAEVGAAAGREVAEAEVEYKNAEAEYNFQSSIQITREHQQATSEVEQSRAAVTRLTQSLSALGAGTGGQGGSVSITSPIAGTVIDRHVSVGQAVTMGTELMTVMNLSSVIIEAQVPETQAARMQAGQRMFARVPGLPENFFEGRIESVGNAVDTDRRTVPVRARISNAGSHLKHEMAVEVRIASGASEEGVLVPVSALVDDEGIKVVYVKEGNRYERRPVTVGIISYQMAEILSGIEEGEDVVMAGAYQLKNMAKGGGEEGGHHDDH